MIIAVDDDVVGYSFGFRFSFTFDVGLSSYLFIVPSTPTILLLWNIHTYTTFYTYTTLHSCSIFFNEIWKSVNSWRYDNDAFASELKDTVSVLLFTTYCFIFPS
jgi:hypothetical protein